MKFLKINNNIKNIYIHIPFCIKKCHYCAFPIHALGQLTDQNQKGKIYNQYCSVLRKQIQLITKMNKYGWEGIQSIYFGGGTPSLLSAGNVRDLLKIFGDGVNRSTQVTLEMNPQQMGKIDDFLEVGINRISIGIQTLNKNTLKQLNRNYNNTQNFTTKQQIIKKLTDLSHKHRHKHQTNINLDFILNLNITSQDKQQIFDLISEIKPKHLSMYMLEVNQGSYLHRNIKKQFFQILKDNDEGYQSLARQLVDKFGYEHYEVSNFCVKGFQSRHNRVYWEGDKQFAGFGMGATSLVNNYRVSRPKNISKYYKYVKILQDNPEKIKDLQYLQIHNEENIKQKLKWVILSKIRRRQGFSWSQISHYFQKQEKSQQIIKRLQNYLIQIDNYHSGILDVKELNKGVRLLVPKGYTYADQIGYKIIEFLNL